MQELGRLAAKEVPIDPDTRGVAEGIALVRSGPEGTKESGFDITPKSARNGANCPVCDTACALSPPQARNSVPAFSRAVTAPTVAVTSWTCVSLVNRTSFVVCPAQSTRVVKSTW